MQEAKAGGGTCPHCFRSFKGARGSGHERSLQPLLLRCGHTFCQGCISKQVKVLKTSIACPACKVLTPMPHGEASMKQLPANYYSLGLATWSTKHVMDMLDQKVETQPQSKLKYEGVQLEGDWDLCSSCHRILASSKCQQCGAMFCETCFVRVHRASRSLQTHPAVPLNINKGSGGCKEHEDREFEFFCQEDQVPICALCALMGSHKGHDIIQLSDQDKDSFKELKPALEIAKKVLKHQYHAMQMAKNTKRDVRKELSDVSDVIKAAFARIHAVLQIREHALVEQAVGIAAQQSQYLDAMLTSLNGNISILESAMIDAMSGLDDEATVPPNITKLVHTLKLSQTLPRHVVVPTAERPQPQSCFTYSSDAISSLMMFGAVTICNEPRLELKTDTDLPDTWEAPEISEDVLNNSAIHNYKKKKKEQNTAVSSRGKAVNAAVKSRLDETNHQSSANKGSSNLVRSPLTARSTNVFARELVRVTHIRNPCCFYIQREMDQSLLSTMMVQINKDCKSTKQSNKLPRDLSIDTLCCCLYDADKTWYRVRIKSVTYPDPEVTTPLPTPPTSPIQTPEDFPEGTAQETEGVRENQMEVKSEGDSEAGSEISSEVIQDVLLEVKPTVKPDGKTDIKPKTKPNGPRVEVIYVDYGNSETVPLSKLCKIKQKHEDLPDLAVCCSLTDIVPTRKSGRWSLEAVHSFAKMVGDKPVYMSILGHSGATLFVDLHKQPLLEVENDMPISLRDALVFLELACFVSPESVPQASHSRGAPLKYISADLPLQGEEILVTVSHFQDPQCFCIQEIGADCEYLLQMMKDLQEAYNKTLDDRWNILCPKIGAICVAHFTEDNQWSRAEIVALPGNQEVDVLYVDYGNYERIHVSKLRKISKKFLKLSVQALPCSLADIGPKDPEKGWTTKENEGFGAIILSKALRATIKGIENGRLSVILLEDRQDREINMNALMVQKEFAQSSGPGSVSAAIIFDIPHGGDFSDDETVKSEEVPSSDSSTETQGGVLKTHGVSQSLGITSSARTQLTSKLVSQYTSVHISHVESPACFYGQLATAGKDGLDSLLETMTLTYKQSESVEDIVWQEGDMCAALLVREGAWCRGRIKTLLPDENAVILFTDYGNTEVVSFINIRPLLARFQKDPPFAIQCHLADVMPGGDKEKWTRTACEFLAATLSDMECVIVKKGELQNGSLPIDLLYEHSIQDKLEQQITEDLGSVAQLLLLKGLALPVRRGSTKTTGKTLEPNRSPTNTSSPRPQSASPLSTQTMKLQTQPSRQSSASPQGLSTESVVSQFESAEDEGQDEFPRYLSPPLPNSGRMDLVITYISPDGVISGLVATEVDTFRDVMERLQLANAICQSVPTAGELREGQAVCAQFQEDGLWYRASILGLHPDTVEVRYVDFGNCEIVPLTSVHLKPFMLEMPQQSHTCILIGLKPKASPSWPDATIQFLLESLVEQTCTAMIQSLCKKGEPLKVDLLLPNDQSISNILVARGMAVSDEDGDGSEPPHPLEGIERSRDVTMGTANARSASPEVDVAMAGPEVEYKPMRLPAKGSQLAVTVTHINQPDMIYVQPWADPPIGNDPVQLETYHQLVELQKLSADLNKLANSLPSVTDPQPGLCCCTLYQVNQQWFRTIILQVKAAEKLCQVQFVDYGTSEWVPTEGLRQIPETFTNLPMQARQCKLVGLKPPSPSATFEGATLPDSDWPMASVDKLLELVSNRKLLASMQYEAPIPGIFLHEVAKAPDQSVISMPQVGRPIHLALIDAGLAQLIQTSPSEGK